MAITSIKTGSSFTNLVKYNDFLGPNSAYIPNSYESIATVTVGAGGSSSVDFNSIPSTYTHLQLRSSIASAATNYALLRFNTDSASNYSYHSLYGDGSSAGVGALTSQTAILGLRSGASSTVFAASILDILDYANTNKYKTTRVLMGNDQNGSGAIFLASGSWRNTNAITSINLTTQSGTFAEFSSFALYGIKGA